MRTQYNKNQDHKQNRESKKPRKQFITPGRNRNPMLRKPVTESNQITTQPKVDASKHSRISDGINRRDITEHVEKLLSSFIDRNDENANPFPYEVFPKQIQEIILATHEHLGFPIDFIGGSILYASSVAIGNTFKIQFKTGWQESAVLYFALVGPSGINKSHPLSFALQPIMDQDKLSYQQYKQQLQEYEKLLSISKAAKKGQNIEEATKPVWKKTLVSDFTPEALAEVHKFNKRGLGAYLDELAGWFKNFNRYNRGSAMEFWLSSWSSKTVSIDRKGGEPIFIPVPFISVAGTIQNGVLSELAKESRTQNGFIERILFVIPENINMTSWSETEISPIIIDSWTSIISSLQSLPFELDESLCPNPEVLLFTSEAKRFLFDWQDYNTKLCDEAEDEAYGGIFRKLEIYAIRLSLVLELMCWACGDGEITAVRIDAIQGAIKLVEYFRNSALMVHSIISNTNPYDRLEKNKQNLYNRLPTTFSTSDGLLIAKDCGIPRRTFFRLIQQKDLFSKPRRGEYKKRI